MDFQKFNERILSSENAEKLQKISQSNVGRSVANMLDEAALTHALQKNDTESLQAMLSQILKTPQGKALASEVKKAVGKNG